MRFPQVHVILTLFLLVLGTGCPQGQPKPGTITITNNDSDVITGFWIRPPSANDWGRSRLASVLFPGRSESITVPAGLYDFKLEDDALDFFSIDTRGSYRLESGGEVKVEWSTAWPGLMVVSLVNPPPGPNPALLTLTNNDSHVITEFWAQPAPFCCGQSLLPSVLFPGGSVSIPILPGKWDLGIQDSNLDVGHLLNVSVAAGQEQKLVWATFLTRAKSETVTEAQ